MTPEEEKKQHVDWYGNEDVIEFDKWWKKSTRILLNYVYKIKYPLVDNRFHDKNILNLWHQVKTIAWYINVTGLDPEFYYALTDGFDKFLNGWKRDCDGFRSCRMTVQSCIDRHFDSFVIRSYESDPHSFKNYTEKLKELVSKFDGTEYETY